MNDNLETNFFTKEYQSWIIFYTLVSTLIFLLTIYFKIPQYLLANSSQNKKNSISKNKIDAKIFQINKTKIEIEKKFDVVLSDQNTKARGKSTNKQKFKSNTKQFDLSIPKAGGVSKSQQKTNQPLIIKKNKKSKNGQFTANIIAMPSIKYGKGNKNRNSNLSGMNQKMSIPEDYIFRDKFVVSFDRYGNPMLPSMKFEHKEYFDRLSKKIGRNWSPPGGNPFYGVNYGIPSGIPGRVSYQPFPEHVIQTAIMLDADGTVIDTKILKSKNIQSLDTSILEAIIKSHNFGKVPNGIIKNGRLIIQMHFPIYYRR